MVKVLHAAGRHQEIDDYCLSDATQHAGIRKRKEYIAGVLTWDRDARA